MNEQNMRPEQNPINVWVVAAIAIIVALISGGVVYALQSSRQKSSEEVLQQQIVLLQNQIEQLEQAQQAPQATEVQDTELVAEENDTTDEQVNKPAGIVYTNSQYGFSLMLPRTWAGYTPKKRLLTWGSLGTSDSVDFGYSVSDSLFNVSIHTKSQWQEIKSEAGPKPTYLGESGQFVFGYSVAQETANSTIISRTKEIPAIVKTFEVLE